MKSVMQNLQPFSTILAFFIKHTSRPTSLSLCVSIALSRLPPPTSALPGVPGTRNENFYDCCEAPYPDVTFVVTLRRRTLYYALNLLIPCVLLAAMTLLMFLLPASCGEKISLGEEGEESMSAVPTSKHIQYA